MQNLERPSHRLSIIWISASRAVVGSKNLVIISCTINESSKLYDNCQSQITDQILSTDASYSDEDLRFENFKWIFLLEARLLKFQKMKGKIINYMLRITL